MKLRSASIGAGGNLNIVGSLVMANGAVGLHADQDLNLLATSESSYAYESRAISKSGIFGNGGLSITIGSKNSTNISSTQETRQASTSVGSLAGDVLATAGGQYLQLSSDITAPQGAVKIAAQYQKPQTQAIREIQASIIDPGLKARAVANVQAGNFNANTIGAGNYRNSVPARFCSGRPCQGQEHVFLET